MCHFSPCVFAGSGVAEEETGKEGSNGDACGTLLLLAPHLACGEVILDGVGPEGESGCVGTKKENVAKGVERVLSSPVFLSR